jgi:hypothetical protein
MPTGLCSSKELPRGMCKRQPRPLGGQATGGGSRLGRGEAMDDGLGLNASASGNDGCGAGGSMGVSRHPGQRG